MRLIANAVAKHGEDCIRWAMMTDTLWQDETLMAQGRRPRRFMDTVHQSVKQKEPMLDDHNVFVQMEVRELASRVEDCSATTIPMLYGLGMDYTTWYKALLIDETIWNRTKEHLDAATGGMDVIPVNGGDISCVELMRVNGNAHIQLEALVSTPAFNALESHATVHSTMYSTVLQEDSDSQGFPAVKVPHENLSIAAEDAQMRIDRLSDGRYILYWRWPSGNTRDASIAFFDTAGKESTLVCSNMIYAQNRSGCDVTSILPYGLVTTRIYHGNGIMFEAVLPGKKWHVEVQIIKVRERRQRLGANIEYLAEYKLLLLNTRPEDIDKLVYEKCGARVCRYYRLPKYAACKSLEGGVQVEGIVIQEGERIVVTVMPSFDAELSV